MENAEPIASKPRRGWIKIIGLALAGVLVFFGYGPVKVLLSAQKHGFFETTQKIDYEGSITKNLNELYKATMLVHDSDGQFPAGDKWMDSVGPRLQTADMKPGEGMKKLVDPSATPGADNFGYALNDAVAGKYKDDIKDKTTVLIFQSSDLKKNAHGDPEKIKRGPNAMAVTLEGKIIRLK